MSRFLLARLHVDQLSAMVIPGQVKTALSQMFSVSDNTQHATTAYNDQYDSAMERITNQPAYEAELARATLAWMTFACRPLTPTELCTAISMELNPDKSVIDPDFMPETDQLLSVCAGLVTLDTEANVIRPTHYTTQEYFDRTHEIWFPDGRRMTAANCIAYLSMKEFKKGGARTFVLNDTEEQEWLTFACNDREDLAWNQRLRKYPLLDYAACFWAEHARPVQPLIIAEITALVEHPGLLSNISSYDEDYNGEMGSSRHSQKMTLMRQLTMHNLDYAVRHYLAKGLAKVVQLDPTWAYVLESGIDPSVPIVGPLEDELVAYIDYRDVEGWRKASENLTSRSNMV